MVQELFIHNKFNVKNEIRSSFTGDLVYSV